jgi:hypothetical protein
LLLLLLLRILLLQHVVLWLLLRGLLLQRPLLWLRQHVLLVCLLLPCCPVQPVTRC